MNDDLEAVAKATLDYVRSPKPFIPGRSKWELQALVALRADPVRADVIAYLECTDDLTVAEDIVLVRILLARLRAQTEEDNPT